MIFNQRYPGVVTGEYAYLQTVELLGFKGAHQQMLCELRDWLERNPPRPASPVVMAQEAYQIHRSFINLFFRGRKDAPIIKELDEMYIQIFGRSGRVVAHGELPRTRQDCYGPRQAERMQALPLG